MLYTEYKAWFERSKPLGMPDDDFGDFLGLIGALTVIKHSEETGDSIDELIIKFFPDNVN